MANVEDLYNMLKAEAEAVRPAEVSSYPALPGLFLKGLRQALRDIRDGADSDTFPSLAMVNFLLLAVQEGVPVAEVRSFVTTRLTPKAQEILLEEDEEDHG